MTVTPTPTPHPALITTPALVALGGLAACLSLFGATAMVLFAIKKASRN
jgi:hypothetical protein